ncbi:hypothetical protein PT974_05451 [Cladobotryum mycophilum]|uniref:GRF-like zinc ribbon domain-containing protein n=1 Tax=Cladobotryum mycophilum TaxID=491253 RepID=A0ABR0SJW2_9HYPO
MNLLPSSTPKHCFQCGGSTSRFKTSANNPNGNAGRPYNMCLHCNKFLGFDDQRGNHLSNPECHCGTPSKMQATGKTAAAPLALHFVCRLGECDFFSRGVGKNGRTAHVRPEMVNILAKAGFI